MIPIQQRIGQLFGKKELSIKDVIELHELSRRSEGAYNVEKEVVNHYIDFTGILIGSLI